MDGSWMMGEKEGKKGGEAPQAKKTSFGAAAGAPKHQK